MISYDEIFGPVLSVFKWKHIDEAIEMANTVEYGLTGAIWTNDLNKALNTARRLQSGHIWINGASGHYKGMPFGGFKTAPAAKKGLFRANR
jgi:betaine-aldehyde dehydrogenase